MSKIVLDEGILQEFYTKDEVISMFTDIQEQLVKQYYINRHELHDDFANIGIEQASNIVEEKINALREQIDGKA